MAYTPKTDSAIQRLAQWYWRRHLSQSSIQKDDVIQFCRLLVIQKQIPYSYLFKELPWRLSNEFLGAGYLRFQGYVPMEYLDAPPPKPYKGLNEEQHVRLLENMWAVGHSATYTALLRYYEGESHDQIGRQLARGVQTLKKCFPTYGSIFSTEPAIWLPRNAKFALKQFKENPNGNFLPEQKTFLARQLRG